MKFNLSGFLEGVAAVQAGDMAGRAAGLQSRQEVTRQQQLLEMQQRQAALQEQEFNWRRQQAEQDDAYRNQVFQTNRDQEALRLLQPGTPEYLRLASRLTGVPVPTTSPAAPFGPLLRAQFAPPGQPEPGMPPLNPQSPPSGMPEVPTPALPAAAPAAPAAASPFRNPADEEAFSGLASRATALFSQATNEGDQETAGALNAYLAKLQQRPPGYTSAQAQQDLNALLSGLQAKGTAKRFQTQAKDAASTLKGWLDDGSIRDEHLETAQTLIGQLSTADPQTAGQILEAYRAFLGAKPFQPGSAAADRKARIELAKSAAEQRASDAAQRQDAKLRAAVTDAIQRGLSPKTILEAVQAQQRHALQNEQYGIVAMGEGRYDLNPRKVSVTPRVRPGEGVQLPGAPGLPPAVGLALGAAEAGLQALPETELAPVERDETAEEARARVLAEIAGEVREGPAQRQTLLAAFNALKPLLTGSRWEAMSEGEKEQILERMNALSERLGIPLEAQLPKTLKADQLPARFREQMRQREEDRKLRRESLDETIRYHKELEKRAREKAAVPEGKPGALTGVEKARLQIVSQDINRRLAEVNTLRRKQFPTAEETKRIEVLIGADGQGGEVGTLRTEAEKILQDATNRGGVTVTEKPGNATQGDARARYKATLQKNGVKGNQLVQMMRAYDARH